MDNPSGILNRSMGGMSGNVGGSAELPAASTDNWQNRQRDFAGGISLNGGTTERSSHSSNPWGTTIWNTSSTSTSAMPFGGFGSTTRDSSRARGTHTT